MSRIFALHDAALNHKRLGTLRYDEGQFGMTIFDSTPVADLPLSLDIFVSTGTSELGHDEVLLWLRGRLCPPGRQNIGQILRELELDSYDEFALLLHTMARCDKDELYLLEEEVGRHNGKIR